MLQIDPTAAVAPSADLVAWSRLGSEYRPADLQQALEVDRTLFECNAVVRPMADLAALSRRHGDVAAARALAGVARGERPVPARHPRAARRCRPAPVPRHRGHEPGPVAVDGLDERPQRHPDARVPDDARRGRHRRAHRAAAHVGPRRARVPRRHAGRPGTTRRTGSGPNGGSGRWASPARRAPPSRSIRTSSARPASRRRSRASGAPGASTPSSSAGRSRAAPPCCRRSTA